MTDDTVLVAGGRAASPTLTLNRPEVHNAFDDALIARLTDARWRMSAQATDVRVVVLAGTGKILLRRCRPRAHEEDRSLLGGRERRRRAGARAPPHGAGRIAQADRGAGSGTGLRRRRRAGERLRATSRIAAERASFALTEVRLGLIPAVISPLRGARHRQSPTRSRFILTGERFGAETSALRIGLVHEVVSGEALEAPRRGGRRDAAAVLA